MNKVILKTAYLPVPVKVLGPDAQGLSNSGAARLFKDSVATRDSNFIKQAKKLASFRLERLTHLSLALKMLLTHVCMVIVTTLGI